MANERRLPADAEVLIRLEGEMALSMKQRLF